MTAVVTGNTVMAVTTGETVTGVITGERVAAAVTNETVTGTSMQCWTTELLVSLSATVTGMFWGYLHNAGQQSCWSV